MPENGKQQENKKWGRYDWKYTSGRMALTREEIHRMLSLINSVYDEALIKLALATGIRREDIVRIELQNIDWEHGIIRFWEEKKNREWRVFVDEATLAVLQKHVEVNCRPYRTKYLFPAMRGDRTRNHLSGRGAYGKFQEALKRAGLEPRPFHTLRATFIKNAWAAGWTPAQIMEQTGDTLETIQLHYATPTAAEMAGVVKEKKIF